MNPNDPNQAPIAPIPPQPEPQPEPTPPPAEPVPPVSPPIEPIPPVYSQPTTVIGSSPTDDPTPVNYPSGNSKKKLIIIIIVIVVVIVLGLIGFLIYSNMSGKGATASSVLSGVTGTADVVDRPDGKLDLSGATIKQSDYKSQTLTAKLNQQVNLSNGLSFMITKVERNYKDYNAKYILKEADSDEIVALDFVVGSRASAGGNSLSLSNTTVTGPATKDTFQIYPTTDNGLTGALPNSTVKPGQQASGKVFYEVKPNDDLTFNYTIEYSNASTNETIKMSVTIKL